MHTYFIRKILSSILFVLSIILIYLIYIKFDKTNITSDTLFLFGALVFFTLFLFIIIFSKNVITKTVYETKIEETKEIELDEELHFSRKDSLAVFPRYKSYKEIASFSEYILKEIAHKFSSVQGVMYIRENDTEKFLPITSFALYGKTDAFVEGEGINGQVASNKNVQLIADIPEGYITVLSGLGNSSPKSLLVVPFVFNKKTIALIELASFENFPVNIDEFFKHINSTISKKINDLINKDEQ